jgi:hypothetical protein
MFIRFSISDKKQGGPHMKRVFYLIIDQLAGHWADGVIVENKFPPANLRDYHRMKLIPNFSHLIDNGVWVERPWNKGICDTSHGMKYLASGFYNRGAYWASSAKGSFFPEQENEEGFFEYAKRHYPDEVWAAVFTTAYWTVKGYFYAPQDVHGLSGCYADELMWRNFAMPYLQQTPDWNLFHLYLPTNDTISFCPSFQSLSFNHALKHISKHHYLLFLDSLVGEIISYLKSKDWWDETYLIVASDHGYHLGCSVAHQMGVKTRNWCCDHGPPYDCEVWDFDKAESIGTYSGGPRRIAFILSGGALGEGYRGKIIPEAEIIDVIPTIAHIMGITYKCEGKSILSLIH